MFRHIASPANRPTNRTRNGNTGNTKISSMVQMSLFVSCFCVYFQAPLRRPEVMKSSDQIADENGQLLSPRWILHSIALSTLANRNVFKTFSRLDFVRTFPQHVLSPICFPKSSIRYYRFKILKVHQSLSWCHASECDLSTWKWLVNILKLLIKLNARIGRGMTILYFFRLHCLNIFCLNRISQFTHKLANCLSISRNSWSQLIISKWTWYYFQQN